MVNSTYKKYRKVNITVCKENKVYQAKLELSALSKVTSNVMCHPSMLYLASGGSDAPDTIGSDWNWDMHMSRQAAWHPRLFRFATRVCQVMYYRAGHWMQVNAHCTAACTQWSGGAPIHGTVLQDWQYLCRMNYTSFPKTASTADKRKAQANFNRPAHMAQTALDPRSSKAYNENEFAHGLRITYEELPPKLKANNKFCHSCF